MTGRHTDRQRDMRVTILMICSWVYVIIADLKWASQKILFLNQSKIFWAACTCDGLGWCNHVGEAGLVDVRLQNRQHRLNTCSIILDSGVKELFVIILYNFKCEASLQPTSYLQMLSNTLTELSPHSLGPRIHSSLVKSATRTFLRGVINTIITQWWPSAKQDRVVHYLTRLAY